MGNRLSDCGVSTLVCFSLLCDTVIMFILQQLYLQVTRIHNSSRLSELPEMSAGFGATARAPQKRDDF